MTDQLVIRWINYLEQERIRMWNELKALGDKLDAHIVADAQEKTDNLAAIAALSAKLDPPPVAKTMTTTGNFLSRCPSPKQMKAIPGLSLLFDQLISILTSPTALALERKIALSLWAELQAKVNEILNQDVPA
ncbi:MAG: hypothetical protein KGL39_08075 [Patescibacteria group bacterium]|nr:hypothetical protein [Patescibacteria group bacterium]